MAIVISYDPSLILGSLVDRKTLDNLEKISAQQDRVNQAKDKLDSLVATYQTIDMTIRQLNSISSDIDTKSIQQEKDTLKQSLSQAAETYSKLTLETEKQTADSKLQKSTTETKSYSESPVDFKNTQIKSLPLSFDSLKMDCQYFSFDNDKQNSSQTTTIKNYIKDSIQVVGKDASRDVSDAVVGQINKQLENHDISGTLIITANCTHRNVTLLDPLILDADKSV